MCNDKGNEIKEMKNTRRFKGDWFQQIWHSIQNEKFGLTGRLKPEQLESFLESHSFEIPDNEPVKDVLAAINYRICELRNSLVPKVKSDAEYNSLTLGDLKKAIDTCFADSTRDQTFSALRTTYIPWLKKNHGGDPKTGLNHLQDPWSMRLRFMEPKIIEEFRRTKHEEPINAATLSKIGRLSSFIFETSSNPTRSRRAKYSLQSIEIEALFKKFGDAYGTEHGRSVISSARKAMFCAGINNIDDVLSEGLFKKIVSVIGARFNRTEFSCSKPFFRWLAKEYNLELPALFEDLQEQPIAILTESQRAYFKVRIEKPLMEQLGYEEKSLNSPLGLFRVIIAALGSSERDFDFRYLFPSDFITVLVRASQVKKGSSYLKSIKALGDCLTMTGAGDERLTFCEKETWEVFKNKFKSLNDNTSDGPLSKFNIAEYSVAFANGPCSWPVFFSKLKNDYYAVSTFYNGSSSKIGKKSHLVKSSHIEHLTQYLCEQAYGEVCANKKKGAKKRVDGKFRVGGLLTLRNEQFNSDEERELDYLASVALLCGGGFRIYSELAEFIWLDREPTDLNLYSPNCIFPKKVAGGLWWLPEQLKPLKQHLPLTEDTMLTFFINGNRKNDLTYLGVLPTVCEDIIMFYKHRRGIKHGDPLLPFGTQTIAHHLSGVMIDLFGINADLDAVLNLEEKVSNFTAHLLRNMWGTYVEVNYHGVERKELQSVLLGHKLNTDSGSDTTAIYVNYLKTCERNLPLLRRIKDLECRTNEQINHEKTREEVIKLREENVTHHRTTHEKLDGIDQHLRPTGPAVDTANRVVKLRLLK
ncbi:MAG: hypothetical protein K2Q26_03940 [Bdellovibrionales bacterium]|nr:hypothetical protein [Bdellovibrionales bacterium]